MDGRDDWRYVSRELCRPSDREQRATRSRTGLLVLVTSLDSQLDHFTSKSVVYTVISPMNEPPFSFLE